MDLSPLYYDPVIEYDHKYDLKAWKKCVELLEKGRYEESLNEFMRYVNSDSAKKYNVGKNHWVIPHGSLMVEIKVTPDNYVEIYAPFLKLPSDNRVALLRQISELNFRVLILSQIVLYNDSLHFTYRTPLPLIDPYKIYDVLKEICWNGDSYDDMFIEKFGAIPLREKKVNYIPQKKIDKAYEYFQAFIDEAFRYDSYFQTKRWPEFSYDIFGITLMKTDWIIAPQGFLRTEIERIVQILFDKKSLEDINSEVRNELMKLKSYSKEHFSKDLYEPNFFIPAKGRSDITSCQKHLAKRYEWATGDRSGGSNTGVVLNFLFSTYHLMFNYFVPEKIKKEILNTNKKCGNKQWAYSADLMWQSFQRIMSLPPE